MSKTSGSGQGRLPSASGIEDFELPSGNPRKGASSTGMDWPDIDLSKLPPIYLLDRMERDREATAAFIGFLRRQAKNEEKYCSGLLKCVETQRPKAHKSSNLLGNLQNNFLDFLSDQIVKPILDETESTSGFLYTINNALHEYAQDRRHFAKFLDSKLCAALEKHVTTRSRSYDSLKKDRGNAHRAYEEARRRLGQAKTQKARAKNVENREEQELRALGERSEDPMSDVYRKQMAKYKESCQRSDKAAVNHAAEDQSVKRHAENLTKIYHKMSRTVQSQEVDRIYDIVCVLNAAIQLEKSTYEKRIQQLTALETKLQVLDPFSDLRLFAHNCEVNEILKRSPAQTKRRRAEEAEKKKRQTQNESQKMQVIVDKFLDAVFEWRRAGVEKQTQTPAEEQLAKEMSNESVADMAQTLVASFDSQTARDVFIRGLNRQRGAQKDVGAFFDTLAETLESLLDACVRHMDVDNCSMVMIMSQTFFRIHPPSPVQDYIVVDGEDGSADGTHQNEDIADDGLDDSVAKKEPSVEKEFMQTRLQRHPVWHDLTYWEETLLRGVRAEVERNCPRSPQEKVRYMYKQIVTAQLRGVVFNMAAFKIPTSLTETLIRRTAIATRMDDAETAQLLETARKVSKKSASPSKSRSRRASKSTTGGKSRGDSSTSHPELTVNTTDTEQTLVDGLEKLTLGGDNKTAGQVNGTDSVRPVAVPSSDSEKLSESAVADGLGPEATTSAENDAKSQDDESELSMWL